MRGWLSVQAPTEGFVGIDWDEGLIWEVHAIDGTAGSACAAVDFNDDGLPEYVLAGAGQIQVVRGDTGEDLYHWYDYNSPTAGEHPLPIDVDADGSLELIVTSGAGIVVLGNASDSWPPGAPSWPVSNYRAGLWAADGSPLPGPSEGSLRAAPMSPPSGPLPDLALQVVSECVSGCEPASAVVFGLRVTNVGQAPFEGSAVVEFRRVPDDQVVGTRTLWYMPHLEPGDQWEPPPPWETTWDYLDVDDPGSQPVISLTLVAEPAPGFEHECLLSDNVVTWTTDACSMP